LVSINYETIMSIDEVAICEVIKPTVIEKPLNEGHLSIDFISTLV